MTVGVAHGQDDTPPAEENAVTVASAVRTKSFDDVLNLLQAIRDACDASGISGSRGLVGMGLSENASLLQMLILMKPDEFVKGGAKLISAVGVYPRYNFDGPGRNELDERHMSMTFNVSGQNLSLQLTIVVWGGASDIRIMQWAKSLPASMIAEGDAITSLTSTIPLVIPRRNGR